MEASEVGQLARTVRLIEIALIIGKNLIYIVAAFIGSNFIIAIFSAVAGNLFASIVSLAWGCSGLLFLMKILQTRVRHRQRRVVSKTSRKEYRNVEAA